VERDGTTEAVQGMEQRKLSLLTKEEEKRSRTSQKDFWTKVESTKGVQRGHTEKEGRDHRSRKKTKRLPRPKDEKTKRATITPNLPGSRLNKRQNINEAHWCDK